MKKILISALLLFGFAALSQDLKLMTYNIRLETESDGENIWAKRNDFLCSQIQFFEPDIFGVQEALPNQLKYLSATMKQYSYLGEARDGKEEGEASCVFYKKDKFTVKKTGTFWLSETPAKVSRGWDAACNRVCTYLLLEDVKTKRVFWVFNTHLDHKGENARINGVKLIMTEIKKLNEKKLSVFFMGDLNAEPESNIITEIKKEMNDSKDISEAKPFGPSGTFNAFKHELPVCKRIDYIFLNKENPFKVKKYAVLSDSKDLKYPSDHLPVYIGVDYQ